MAGTPDVSGAASSGRGAPTLPSAATASPCPGASFEAAAADGLDWSVVSGWRDCTATEPLSTDAVVWPDSPIATPKWVPRTLVTARGVRSSKRRKASALGGTLDSTAPLRISSTDCRLPARPRRRSCRSSSSDCACTRTTVPSASLTETKASGPTCSAVPSSSLPPWVTGAGASPARAWAVTVPCTNSTVADSAGCRRTGIHTTEPGTRRRGLVTLLRACSSGHCRGAAR